MACGMRCLLGSVCVGLRSEAVAYPREGAVEGAAQVEVASGALVLVGIVVAILFATRKKPGRPQEPKPPTAGEAMRDDWGRR